MEPAAGNAPDLSVVVPVYNEEAIIERSLPIIVAAMQQSGLRYELIAVDDGSSDRSFELLNAMAAATGLRIIRHETNRGASAAVRTGLQAAQGRYAICLDADLQFAPADALRFYHCARHLGLSLLASRSDKGDYPFYRKAVSNSRNFVLQRLFNLGSHIDINGLNLIETGLFRQIKPTNLEEVIGAELMVGAAGQGRPLLTLPVKVGERIGGKSSFRYGLILKGFASLPPLLRQAQRPKPQICLSFDLEEWRVPQHFGVEHPLNATTEFSKAGLRPLLDLLQRKQTPSTFFVTGYYAEREPDSVRKVQRQGHEIACHSYEDLRHAGRPRAEIDGCVRRATDILTQVCGRRPIGFRAPMFSGAEALRESLAQQGYRYDSSAHPAIVPGRYMDFRAPRSPYIAEFPGRAVAESEPAPHPASEGPEEPPGGAAAGARWLAVFPVSVIPGLRMPISWWWMRNIGLWLTLLGAWLNLKGGRNVTLYFHPWEFVDTPRVAGVPRSINRGPAAKHLRKLEKFIAHFQRRGYRFATMESLLR